MFFCHICLHCSEQWWFCSWPEIPSVHHAHLWTWPQIHDYHTAQVPDLRVKIQLLVAMSYFALNRAYSYLTYYSLFTSRAYSCLCLFEKTHTSLKYLFSNEAHCLVDCSSLTFRSGITCLLETKLVLCFHMAAWTLLLKYSAFVSSLFFRMCNWNYTHRERGTFLPP